MADAIGTILKVLAGIAATVIGIVLKILAVIAITAVAAVILFVVYAIFAPPQDLSKRLERKLTEWLASEGRTTTAVVVLGITGAGKSALLNILFRTAFETGCGRPITTEGLHQQDVERGGNTLRVFDSCGFETRLDTEKSRQELLSSILEKCTRDALTVLYCIDAASGRINEIDKRTVKDFEDEGVHVVIAFTKADQTSEEDTEAMRQVLRDAGVHSAIVDVCTVESGQSKRFGVEEVLDAIIGGK